MVAIPPMAESIPVLEYMCMLEGAWTFDNGLSNLISNIPDLYSTL
jgi:hypothetical protein